MLALHRHLRFPRIARTNEDLINTLDWGDFRSTYHDFDNALPEPYRSWLDKMQFKITNEYLNEIRRLCRHGHEEWGDAVTKKWSKITTPLAIAEINAAFELIADCAWDAKTKYFYRNMDKPIIPYALKYRFWFRQVNINNAVEYSNIEALRNLNLPGTPEDNQLNITFYSALMNYQESAAKSKLAKNNVSSRESLPDGSICIKKLNVDEKVSVDLKPFGFSRVGGRTVATSKSSNPVINTIETRTERAEKVPLRFSKENEEALNAEYDKLTDSDFNPVPEISRDPNERSYTPNPELEAAFDSRILLGDWDKIKKFNDKLEQGDYYANDLEEEMSKAIDEYAAKKLEEVKEEFGTLAGAIEVASQTGPQKDALLESVEIVRTYVKDGVKIVERQKHDIPPRENPVEQKQSEVDEINRLNKESWNSFNERIGSPMVPAPDDQKVYKGPGLCPEAVPRSAQ